MTGTVLDYQDTESGREFRLPNGALVARAVYHGSGFYELWVEPDFKREGNEHFPFLWCGLEAIAFAALALASDAATNPQKEG